MSDSTSNPDARVDPVRITEPGTKFRDFLGRVATDPDSHFDEASIAFGNGLAEYFNDGIIPAGFVMATTMFTVDCARNQNGHTGEPMPEGLAGYPRFIYTMFEMTAIDMARGAFGDTFADQAQAFYDRVANK